MLSIPAPPVSEMECPPAGPPLTSELSAAKACAARVYLGYSVTYPQAILSLKRGLGSSESYNRLLHQRSWEVIADFTRQPGSNY